MTHLLNYKTILSVAALGLAVAFLLAVIQGPREAIGSARPGDEYMATSTAGSTAYGATVTSGRMIKRGAGVLGTVVITGANTGVVNFYDATTTNVSLRTGNKATSTILIASFPASAAAGTYVFDDGVNDGIYIDLVSGTMPTTTVLYR